MIDSLARQCNFINQVSLSSHVYYYLFVFSLESTSHRSSSTSSHFHSLHRKRVEMEKDCEFVLLGPGDVVINITNNNLDCLPDLNTYLCNEGGEGRSSTTMEEVYCKRKSTEEERAAPLSSFAQTPLEPPIFRAKRGRPCSEPPTREVVTKRRKVLNLCTSYIFFNSLKKMIMMTREAYIAIVSLK